MSKKKVMFLKKLDKFFCVSSQLSLLVRQKANIDKGFKHYELLLVYVDNILVIIYDGCPILNAINAACKIKLGSDGPLKLLTQSAGLANDAIRSYYEYIQSRKNI